MSTTRSSCEDKSILFTKDASLYATTQSVSRSSLGMRMDALLSLAYLMVVFRRLKCLDESYSSTVGVTCAICEISNLRFGLVFANHAKIILMEANLLKSASFGNWSILFKYESWSI